MPISAPFKVAVALGLCGLCAKFIGEDDEDLKKQILIFAFCAACAYGGAAGAIQKGAKINDIAQGRLQERRHATCTQPEKQKLIKELPKKNVGLGGRQAGFVTFLTNQVTTYKLPDRPVKVVENDQPELENSSHEMGFELYDDLFV